MKSQLIDSDSAAFFEDSSTNLLSLKKNPSSLVRFTVGCKREKGRREVREWRGREERKNEKDIKYI
tara:strand:- start:435 stop:632 length:198 start_codon:yes stop_codon:yes gene_type:complete